MTIAALDSKIRTRRQRTVGRFSHDQYEATVYSVHRGQRALGQVQSVSHVCNGRTKISYIARLMDGTTVYHVDTIPTRAYEHYKLAIAAIEGAPVNAPA